MNPLEQLEPLIAPAADQLVAAGAGLVGAGGCCCRCCCGAWLRLAQTPAAQSRTGAANEAATRPAAPGGAARARTTCSKPYNADARCRPLAAAAQRHPQTPVPRALPAKPQPYVLSSRAWLAFLDSRCPAAGLTRWMVLVEGAYRPHCSLDDKAIAGLNQAVSIWIRKHV